MEEQDICRTKEKGCILIADGQKKAAILEAEGAKQSKDIKMQKVQGNQNPGAEGDRVSQILSRRVKPDSGYFPLAQCLLIKKALTVLTFDMMKSVRMASNQDNLPDGVFKDDRAGCAVSWSF